MPMVIILMQTSGAEAQFKAQFKSTKSVPKEAQELYDNLALEGVVKFE